jgi:hypothetical protein
MARLVRFHAALCGSDQLNGKPRKKGKSLRMNKLRESIFSAWTARRPFQPELQQPRRIAR